MYSASTKGKYLEFLRQLSKYPPDEHMRKVWNSQVGSVDDTIREFLNCGWIRQATNREKIFRKYDLNGIQSILKKYKIARKGVLIDVQPGKKKDVLIDLLVKNVSEDIINALVEDYSIYSVTERGQKLIDEYFAYAKDKTSKMHDDALGHLRNGDVCRAGELVSKYETGQVFSRGLGIDWSKGMDENTIKRAEYLLKGDYNDLMYDGYIKKEVSCILALTTMLGNIMTVPVEQILKLTGGDFKCSAIETFLQNPCGGMASTYFDSPRQKLELYIHAKLFGARNTLELKQIIANGYGKGVEIIRVKNDDCPLCKMGKSQYLWAEIDSIPELPRHWGCRCLYSGWW